MSSQTQEWIHQHYHLIFISISYYIYRVSITVFPAEDLSQHICSGFWKQNNEAPEGLEGCREELQSKD